ncbi:zinc finger FYVE domain-containing protein 26 homolog [Zeugodacus cucurbitae]|uniref:zinc finger FYVE domain-containing protein 26 homolog n=1 Tax=Zeugodacus cucurbitae TaxID=28588 RepID=UPI000596899F|nr:zinc finger FYVE domain-containing protein 26 homolog [Zeugodacus cucurbitae]
MDDLEVQIQQYLEVLPFSESNFLKSWLQSLQPHSNSNIAPNNYENITQLLLHHIYPVLQILNVCREKYKLPVSRVCAEALQLLLQQNVTENRTQFINFIANCPLNVLDNPPLRCKLIKTLITEVRSADDVCLALLARHETNLLVEVLEQSQEQYRNCSNGVPNKEFILQQTLRNKQHFAPLIAKQLKNASNVQNKGLRNNMLILKIADEFSNIKQTLSELGNINKWLSEYNVDESPLHLKEIHKFFYADFQRITIIVDFLKRFSALYKTITLEAILNSRSILKLLYDYDIDTSFEETRRLLEATRKWQMQLTNMKSIYELEMETLNYYTALSTVCDIMLPNTNPNNLDTYYECKIQQLNGMLRKILNVDMLCALIEDIFQLIFLRWEHLRHASNIYATAFHTHLGNAAAQSSGVSSTAEAAVETPTASMRSTPLSADSGRQGFICRGPALHAIFAFLKNFITKKIHSEDYKLASGRVQLRFQRIIDVITEALWKYAVLQKFDNSLTSASRKQKFGLEAEELLQLIHAHIDAIEKSSSDDDSRDRSNHASLSRRKAARKKRRATISVAAGIARPAVQAGAKVDLMINSVNAAEDTECNAVEDLKSRREFNRLTERSIIPQMLGSPENLAIMALSLKNFSDVKFIIETFHLQNTALNRELVFVEQQQQIKQKLATIYENYLQKVQSGKGGVGDGGAPVAEQPAATVEQIRNVAGKGFDVSRIISVIDTFALTQRIEPTAEQQQLCQRYMSNPQYAFLRNFDTDNLNAFIITDLVLNLPFNREITSNILTVVRRQQQLKVGASGAMSRSLRSDDGAANKQQLYSDIGALALLESLSECLQVQPQQRLCRLLNDNYYSLKPRKLALEMQRERAFAAVFHKTDSEIGHIDDLKTHAPLFHELQAKCNYYQRFIAYVQQLAQLMQLRDRNLEYHTGAILKINVCDVIGELIFDCDMTPLEIEANVAALNLNLVHVIALNVCPEIAGKCGDGVGKLARRKIEPQKSESILNYVANQNALLACLLQGVISATGVPLPAKNLNTSYLQALLELSEIERVATLFNDNKFVAALRSDYDPSQLVADVASKLTQLKLQTLDLGYQPKALQQRRTDQLLLQLIEEDARNIRFAGGIQDVGTRAKLIQANFTKIATTRLAKELIENTLQNRAAAKRIPSALRSQLEATLADITIYAKVSEVLQFETWPQAYDFGMKTPTAIFEQLLQSHLYKLCYNWCRVVKLAERFAAQKQRFLDLLLNALLELHDDVSCNGSSGSGSSEADGEVNKYLLKILETFPTADVAKFLDTHKDKFRTVHLMRYSVDYLTRCNPHESQSYRNYKISLVIFEQLTPGELAPFWKLFTHPLLIIEQLVMNTKFETLTKVLTAVRTALAQAEAQVCAFCFDKRGHIYDIHTRSANSPHKVKFQLGTDTGHTNNSAFILLNFNLYQKHHVISNECIDLLLRIYGTKALDYHVSDVASSSERISQTTDMQQSLDSLCGAFQMPALAPTREDWVRDDDATHCMCCHRAAFTMLMRRHHCRRCGRVVCFACSAHRMRIPDLYEDVEVRVCNDCFSKTEEVQRRRAQDANAEAKAGSANNAGASGKRARDSDAYKWQLCGNITHDKLLREEFCYEHAPSVALCLSILAFHQGQQKCVDLLLYHCHKLEKLFVPNPEVDYELVAKMMNCLALAAKVRGGPPEIETIREHSMIIMSVVQNGCESLIPPGPLNNHSLRKLGDSLVQAEKWDLAFEVHLKCGFPTVGVMAAHGLSCLRAGCFDTAREKFSYCMTKLSSEYMNEKICKYIMSTTTTPDTDTNDNPFESSHQEPDIQITKRPQRGPPLLQEIVKTIESTPCLKPQPETLKRASLIRSSNTSLASMLSRRKDPCPIRMHEPALGILNTLANLKHIAKGQYNELHNNLSGTHTNLDNKSRQYVQHTRGFEECLYYVLTYGSHTDVLQFLMRHRELNAALKYLLQQNLESEYFIHNIFLGALRHGSLPTLIEHMQKMDASLSIWRVTLLQTCHYLETQNHLNSLYQLQLLLHDPVRASMTCVRFYSANCETFQHLHANAMHLHNAQQHLQSQLELTQWDKVNFEPLLRNRKGSVSSRRTSVSSGANTPATSMSFLMHMDARALNSHINTIAMQLEVAKFLAHCERELSAPDEVNTLKMLKQLRLDNAGKLKLPTLFDGAQERIQVCILILLCGKNTEEGFGLAYRIIHHYKLPEVKVFGASAKFLACNQRIVEVEKLISCITSNNGIQTRDIDEILSIAINSASNSNDPEVKTILDNLVKRIHSVELRISCHIFIGQLKSAYLLANKYERIGDIRRILRQAELTNQVHIKKLCERKLNVNAAARNE